MGKNLYQVHGEQIEFRRAIETDNVEDMSEMFKDCHNLNTFILSNKNHKCLYIL